MTTNWQDPAGTPPQPPNGGSHYQSKGKRFAIVAILLVVIAGLGTAAGLVMVNRNSDDVGDSPQYVVMDIADTTPVFEPLDAVGADPFFHLEFQKLAYQEEVEEQIDQQVAIAQANAEPGETVIRPEFDIAALDEAVKTGLYGGTAENTCDPERLISFLYANPDLGEQWALVQGILFSEIADYIRSLDVQVLAEPLRVDNYGYDSTIGAAYQIDTILEAGTAVLVDENGDVRTRCYCGNPITPKQPEAMPPRCLVFGSLVYTEPAGSTKRDDVPRDVLLTGRQATANGGSWIEVKWGTGDNQVGWTQANNVRKHFCPTPTSDRFCPGPGATNVWHTPDMTTQVGQVTGKVRTHDTTLDIFAPISPVGGIGNETVVNDFMLIRFKEAANSVQNSAWVKLADLNQDPSECERIRQCIETDGAVWDRAGGGVLAAGGTMWVEFTGHFIGDPLVTFAEVRLNNGTGNYGWISNFYTPLTDEECQPPVYECIEAGVLWANSNPSGPADFLGFLANVDVTILDGPENGHLQVHVDAPTGPIGWVDVSDFYDGHSDCSWPPECSNTTGMAWTEFATNGVSKPADASPRMISYNGAQVGDGGIDYLWINDGGINYWIDTADLNSLPAEECDDGDPDCTMVERGAADEFTPTDRDPATLDPATESRVMLDDEDREAGYLQRCCVDALYNTPDLTDPAADPVPRFVFVIDTENVDGVDWFETFGPRFFTEADIVDPAECEMPECPEGVVIPGKGELLESLIGRGELLRADGLLIDTSSLGDPGEPEFGGLPNPVGGECCVSQLFTAQGLGELPMADGPEFVTIASGPHGAAPAWYMTTDGEWFPETAIVNPEQCRPNWDCPTDDTEPGVPGSRLRDLDDELVLRPLSDSSTDAVILKVAIDGLAGIPSTRCCVDGNVYDDIDGALKGTFDEPTIVFIIDINEDGTWYEILIDGALGDGWVMADQFLPLEDCRPDEPCQELLSGKILDPAQVRETCCAEVVNAAGAIEIVTLTGETRETEAGTEYMTTDGEWVLVVLFLPNEQCQPDGGNCPEFSLIEVQALAAGDIEICCIAVGNGFEAAGLTGEAMFDEEGNVTHLERNTGEWIPIEDFVGAGRCEQDAECPTVSLISPNDPLTCCVSLGGGEFEEVTLNGEQREGDDGTEYQATNGEWYLFPDDFASAGRCQPNETPCNGTIVAGECCERPNVDYQGQCVPPCPTGQVRNANGECVTPETPCPTGTVRNNAGECVEPACQDSDDDGICDTDDNCEFNPNRDQADADQDGSGDPCDPCTDTDQDRFCEIPGDINDDNCYGIFNPGQTDSDGDLVGDLCDNCPNTPNADQLNTDGIGTGDACEQPDCPRSPTGAPGDIDQDGICNDDDNCPQDPNPNQEDTFGERGVGDACETRCPSVAGAVNGDRDGDGVCDLEDNCPGTANPGQQNGDDDIYGDACDLCPNFPATSNFDSDGDGWGDDCDICPGANGPVNASQIPNPDQGFLYDTNGDNINDSCFPPFGLSNN